MQPARDCAAHVLSHALLRLPVHTVADCIHNTDLAVRRPAPRVVSCRVNDVLFQVRHCRRLDVSLSTLPAAVTHLIVPAPAPPV
jgi:hypothetical protein